MSKINKASYYGFMKNHTCPKGDNSKQITNTSLKGGRYHISDKEYPEFLKLYYENIVSKGREEFLTEKQLDITMFALLACFVFRYPISIELFLKDVGQLIFLAM